MGSEMCIRDRAGLGRRGGEEGQDHEGYGPRAEFHGFTSMGSWVCLLYTSDAADERSSVDLGGRRIIKKKKKTACEVTR